MEEYRLGTRKKERKSSEKSLLRKNFTPLIEEKQRKMS